LFVFKVRLDVLVYLENKQDLLFTFNKTSSSLSSVFFPEIYWQLIAGLHFVVWKMRLHFLKMIA